MIAVNDNLTGEEFDADVEPIPSVAPISLFATVISVGRFQQGWVAVKSHGVFDPVEGPVLIHRPFARMPHPECPPMRGGPRPERAAGPSRPAFIRGVIAG